MLLSSALDPIMCRAFSTTFKKVSLRWFTTLATWSIDSFKQLSEAFCTHFTTSKAPRKMSVALVNFQQGRWETLKEYLAHFNLLALKVKDLNKGIVVHHITAGLWVGHFSLSLTKKPITSLTECWHSWRIILSQSSTHEGKTLQSTNLCSLGEVS